MMPRDLSAHHVADGEARRAALPFSRSPSAAYVTAGLGAESALQALSGGHPAGGAEPPDTPAPAPPATYQLLTRWRRRRYDRRVARMSQLGEGWPR